MYCDAITVMHTCNIHGDGPAKKGWILQTQLYKICSTSHIIMETCSELF